ncbi:MAG: flagellar biosynthesis protein FliQ [Pseudomonadota bacterium]
MTPGEAVEYLDLMLWSALIVAAPVLIAALVVGLVVSIFQVATQLQEMTLSYVPKLLVAAFILIAMGPWMLQRITQFAVTVISTIPDMH